MSNNYDNLKSEFKSEAIIGFTLLTFYFWVALKLCSNKDSYLYLKSRNYELKLKQNLKI